MELAPVPSQLMEAPPMSQMPLFSLPPAYAITIRLEVDGTWTCTVSRMHTDRSWDDSGRSTYSKLSLNETIDVIAGELFTA